MALRSVGIDVAAQELVGMIGPNGAGKTSLLNAVSGHYAPNSGSVYFGGQEVTRWSPQKRVAGGIARTFQNVELFNGLTVIENLMAGRHTFYGGPLSILRENFVPPFLNPEERRQRALAESVIDLLDLQRFRHNAVSELPYGVRKIVDLGRALCLEPRLLLLDEPMAGMNVDEKAAMVRYLLAARREHGMAVVLVEHDMQVVTDVVERAIVLNFGEVIAQGPPHRIAEDEAVIEAYIGRAMGWRRDAVEQFERDDS